MKVRIISSAVGLVLLAVVLSFFNTIVLNVVLAIIAVIAVWELLHATGVTHNLFLTILGMVVAALIPFIPYHQVSKYLTLYALPYIGVLFVILLLTHRTTRIEHIAMTAVFSMAVPFAFSTAVYLRDIHGWLGGIFYILIALGGGWLSDSGAYFTGTLLGKHKLAPEISPKKTVEGAIGGVLTCALGYLLIAYLFEKGAHVYGISLEVNYLSILILAPVASISGIIGDLSASIIKREYGIKDFGHIMPGHGGVMDRFDSVLFVLPLVYLLSLTIPNFSF